MISIDTSEGWTAQTNWSIKSLYRKLNYICDFTLSAINDIIFFLKTENLKYKILKLCVDSGSKKPWTLKEE